VKHVSIVPLSALQDTEANHDWSALCVRVSLVRSTSSYLCTFRVGPFYQRFALGFARCVVLLVLSVFLG